MRQPLNALLASEMALSPGLAVSGENRGLPDLFEMPV